MQCRLNQEKYLRKYSVKKHKEKPDRVYLAYKKVDNNRIEKEKRKVANDYLTQTVRVVKLTNNSGFGKIIEYYELALRTLKLMQASLCCRRKNETVKSV